jgi:hypothetical protein
MVEAYKKRSWDGLQRPWARQRERDTWLEETETRRAVHVPKRWSADGCTKGEHVTDDIYCRCPRRHIKPALLWTIRGPWVRTPSGRVDAKIGVPIVIYEVIPLE